MVTDMVTDAAAREARAEVHRGEVFMGVIWTVAWSRGRLYA